jgi:hypothetical protein
MTAVRLRKGRGYVRKGDGTFRGYVCSARVPCGMSAADDEIHTIAFTP